MLFRTSLGVAVSLLAVQGAYLAVASWPSLFYVANVFLHHYGGLLAVVLAALPAWRALRGLRRSGSPAFPPAAIAMVLAVGAVAAAVALDRLHNTTPHRWILRAHAVLAFGALIFGLVAARKLPTGRTLRTGAAAAAVVLVVGAGLRAALPPGAPIQNPRSPPADMAGEVMGGEDGPFFPSAIHTSTGGTVPADFLTSSGVCARCHADIHEQWSQSAHRFSSFNNQWYRKSIEYMQEVSSVEASMWCGGCHDPAVLLSGAMDQPVESFLDSPEAHEGIACIACHGASHVRDTMGNGALTLQYRPLHQLVTSPNPPLRKLLDRAIELDPGPHRRAMLQPFHREQTAEFCSSCHKAHLDVPVNRYRWRRGFNEYDSWQSSGVSGLGARAFYYPSESMDCADCHMPLVPSRDAGHRNGFVHDHSFPAANTALPVANLHEDQLRRTIEFLQAGKVTVDIFVAAPAESGQPSELPPLWGPLDRERVTVERGGEVRVDVVVRTRNVGHSFPGGTVDAFDVWLELVGRDETGRILFWSGAVRDGGSGPVDGAAHFYGARLVDAHGNPIERRNAWAARATVWENVIPPGAADVARFRMTLPEDCGKELHMEARLNYRKFSRANTRFSFAGAPSPGEPAAGAAPERVGPHFDDREFLVGEVPPDVSAELREIPDLPVVVLHRATATLSVAPVGADVQNALALDPADWERWNDYGIGLLLQGDLAAARTAFGNVTRADPERADGFLNRGRAELREGDLDAAASSLAAALERDGRSAAAHHFLGIVAKQRGDHAEALERLRTAATAFPEDRVVRGEIGRVLLLERRYEEAVREFGRVLEIDPEDRAAHYNLMLCYRGLGRKEEAERERVLYERFKEDENAEAILGPYLREHPEENRMRQPIHEQISMAADVIAREGELRAAHGEGNVVLPGEAASYARRVMERGERLRQSLAADRPGTP